MSSPAPYSPPPPPDPETPRPPAYTSRGGTGMLASFRHAWDGLIHTAVHQRNMRVHLVSAVLVALVGSGIPLGVSEKVILIFCVLLIFFAEILNSALEHLVDLATRHFDEKARLTKDAAAAGVLVLAIGTVVIFVAILVNNWETVAASGPQIARQVTFGLPHTLCVTVLVLPQPRARWVDMAAFVGGALLLGVLTMRSVSSVFTAMNAGLLLLAASAARQRRRERAARPPG
ncbi:diacylglycerol kinase family protein [Cystobacter ferrugineus]|uniref:Diacylglycerol kinase n=1 Tax=Cystobacter ferrugineus TaxID=83449 RepID=A0A1L9BCD0_9BACT|nr:diacylglycerol kinase family protein [Cystobacter ferrugineus]OJH39905.1 diacylglycerol kinase [Cystobacter ferrugineus]